jgi:hypothetical protein
LKYSIYEKATDIGMTGWDWQEKKSRWVGFDFDAITGHAAGVGVEEADLTKIQEKAKGIPWVEVRASTSGRGLHLYVYLEDFHTETHTEHQAIARCILGIMGTEVGFDFASAVDCAGGNMWVWSTRATRDNGGFGLIKPAECKLSTKLLPSNWKDQVEVVTKQRNKVRVTNVSDVDNNSFENLTASRKIIPLDEIHKELIQYLGEHGYSTIWVPDHHLLQAHTYGLKQAHAHFEYEGYFDTLSQGKDPGQPNCFLFPMYNGAWKVYRFSPGAPEHSLWDQNGEDWTSCLYNRKPTFDAACKSLGGVELSGGKGYQFDSVGMAQQVCEVLGQSFTVPDYMIARETVLKIQKNGTVLIRIKHEKGDKAPDGFVKPDRVGYWERVLGVKLATSVDDELCYFEFDNKIRNLITPNLKDGGWYIRNDRGDWVCYEKSTVKDVLSMTHNGTQIGAIMGESVLKGWYLVNLPFHDEYPGNRQWNLGAAQFRYQPTMEEDFTKDKMKHWDMILNHCGQELDEYVKDDQWCIEANIKRGGDYLRMWIASMLRFPFEPLPYLFLFSQEQNTGKSILWEAIQLLMDGGICKADTALTTKSDFNGELANAVLAVVEETNISVAGERTQNRMKDWVTSPFISVRKMRTDSYLQKNTLHFIQTANHESNCPVLAGDTRITMMYVPAPKVEIAKPVLIKNLEAEAPYFMRSIMDLHIPTAPGRLRLPVIHTSRKNEAEEQSMTVLESFLHNECFYVEGEAVLFSDFYDKFIDYILELGHLEKNWSKFSVSKGLPSHFPTGVMKANIKYIGNISFTEKKPSSNIRYIREGKKLVEKLISGKDEE